MNAFSLQRLSAISRLALARLRVGLSILSDGLGPLGVGGLAALAAGTFALSSATATETEALALEAQAAALHGAARNAALARARAPSSQRREAVANSTPSLELPLQRPTGTVLPASVLAQAEQRGLRLGPVEYRPGRGSASIRRVDVQLTASGRYLAARQWLADTLEAMPHAQLVELTLQRGDPAEPDLEIRVVLAVHFGART
jgi:hypothetical protein